MIMLYHSAEVLTKAYWWKRFSEEIKTPSLSYIVERLKNFGCTPVPTDLIEFFEIKYEPVFDREMNLVAVWHNMGPIARPSPKLNSRFFERWNGKIKNYEVWVYKEYKK